MRFEEYLNEKYLLSQFNFGFELECICKKEDYKSSTKQLVRYWNGGDVGKDSSISTKNDERGIEYKSKILEFTPANISKFIKFLDNIYAMNVYTNKSCGFHIHVSFPDLNQETAAWIIMNLAMDKSMIKKISKMDNFNFINQRYADDSYLNSIEKSIKNREYKSLKQELGFSKYRVIRIHPQGTLEWRGPRDFLNKGRIGDIRKFTFLLHELIRWYNNTLDKKELDGLSKNEWIDETLMGGFDSIYRKFPWLKKAKFNEKDVTVSVEDGKLVWEDGEWQGGVWEDGIWEDGMWYDGEWQNGTWENGTWKNGTWKNGTWKNGDWLRGTWYRGIWKRGNWESGTWKNGTWEKGIWYDGTWENGTWEDGIWRDGTWESGTWKAGTWWKGTWQKGYWQNGEWYNGTWEDGTWVNGTWENGTWEDGTWENGTWEDGTWENGRWEGGNWLRGTWKNGIWEDGTWISGTWIKGKINGKPSKEPPQ